MRRVRAAIVVLALSVLSLAFAGPASAGGPTSVLLAEPATHTAASFYYTDADYESLADLVGVNAATPDAMVDETGEISDSSGEVTMTWLVHDVAVWRVDRVYLHSKGGPMIATQSDMNSSGNVYDSPVSWHRATDGPALVALLERNGFGGDLSVSAGDDAAPEVPSPDLTPVTPAPQNTSQPAGPTSTWGGWAWGLAGLALGVALTMGAVRVLPRTRPVTGGDATAAPAEPLVSPTAARDDDRGDDRELWSMPDELSRSGG